MEMVYRKTIAQSNSRTTQQCSDSEIAILKLNWKRCADKLVQTTNPKGKFEISPRNKQIVEGLFWWFFNDPRSCYDLNKGILLKGDKGTGKTTLIKSFRDFFREMNQSFRFETAMKISLDYAQTGDVSLWLKPNIVSIDEIGRERMAKHFGNELSVMQYILHERYSIWQNTGVCTIATTNMDANDIESMYGEIIRDRVKEMFNHIPLTGESRR